MISQTMTFEFDIIWAKLGFFYLFSKR